MMKNHCLTHQEIEDRLHRADIQPTAQRIAICRYVLCEGDHPTAEDVKSWADDNFPKISLATVYNTLATLVEAGLLKEFKFPHTDKVVYDCNTSQHFHFLDKESKMLYDLDPDDVAVDINLPDIDVADIELVITGTRKA